MSDESAILKIQNLETGYGRTPAVFEANFDVKRREILTLIGHNGAGKTTILRTIFGILRPWRGTIVFDGHDLSKTSTSHNVHLGLGIVQETNFVFRDLTVAENLSLGGFNLRPEISARNAEEILEVFPVLKPRRKQRAGLLSGGEQRMLSLAMVLIPQPRLLLLDEPSLGLAPTLVEQLMDTIAQIARERNLSVILVEQNVHEALRIADRACVMRAGRTIYEEAAAVIAARGALWELF